ncbi:MAG: hypothetical protein K1W40_17900 [Schaedlerella sp.]|uniref:hypothetical protein n=1 Tax=Schaedlerella sp. TaxID=2676057 RepID=UPI002604A188|nr:hypothetical protein [uncultured Schaedlerella sp.]
MKSIKRKMRWIMYTALFLLLSACEKNEEAVLKPGIYTLQDYEREVPGDFTITIFDDGTFQCYETPISSYIGMGHYSIEKDVVTLKEDAAGCTGDVNYYQIADENLLFISEESYNYHFVPLEDGASFTWTSDIK